MKTCIKCLQIKSLDEFFNLKKAKDGKNYRCKSCIKEYQQTFEVKEQNRLIYNKRNNSLERKKYMSDYYKKDTIKLKRKLERTLPHKKEWQKSYNLFIKYWPNLNRSDALKEYNKLLIKYDNCCGICRKHRSLFSKDLAVDHCHKTGKIRGLLCEACNRGLGLFKDSDSLLNNAILYLKEIE